MDQSLRERPAVVITGASTGIGAASAVELAGRGFRVFAGVRRPCDGQRLKAQSPHIVPLLLDVTVAGQIAAAAETVGRAVGDAGLAGLVNNAGIVVAGPLEILPLDQLRLQLEVNVVGQIAVTQAFLPLLAQGARTHREHELVQRADRLALPCSLRGLQARLGGRQQCHAAGTSHLGDPRFGDRARGDDDAHLGQVLCRRGRLGQRRKHRPCTKATSMPCGRQRGSWPLRPCRSIRSCVASSMP